MIRLISILSVLTMLVFLPKAKIVTEPTFAPIPTQAKAGTYIKLHLPGTKADSRLLLTNAYGQSLITPDPDVSALQFTIPRHMARKAGILSWKLIGGALKKQGTLLIEPLPEAERMENYFGPRSIQAGPKDFTMLVSVPVDQYDNPLADGAKIPFTEYYKGSLKRDTLKTQNLFAWKNIFSKEKAGSIQVTTSCGSLQTKEMITQIFPSPATNFTISASREHDYADGNQILTFQTSVIQDRFDNTVSDGTTVDFIITTSEANILKTSSTTINGLATAKILHPEQPEEWKIRAIVNEMAESPEISLRFKPVLNDFIIEFEPEKNAIVVRALVSYAGQLIPDGATVDLEILDPDGEISVKMTEQTQQGRTPFKHPLFTETINQKICRVTALGTTKTIQLDGNKSQ